MEQATRNKLRNVVTQCRRLLEGAVRDELQGRFGVYNSFLLHAERAADRYGVSAHEILRRVGEAGYVGGQEDMIVDIALTIVAQKQTQSA